MNIRYSPSTGSFYPLDIDYGDNLPADVITVDYDLYTQAMARPTGTNFTIADDALVVIDPAPAPYGPQAAAYMDTVRATREKILTRITGIWVASDDDGLKAACKVARQNLLDITKVPDILAATNMDDLKTAVLTAYRNIVAASPAEIVSAFNGMDT